jgi:hypothetical protein
LAPAKANVGAKARSKASQAIAEDRILIMQSWTYIRKSRDGRCEFDLALWDIPQLGSAEVVNNQDLVKCEVGVILEWITWLTVRVGVMNEWIWRLKALRNVCENGC